MTPKERNIGLAHGNGGRYMRELIDELFAARLANPYLDVTLDAVPISLEEGRVMVTTDGFTVQPLEFPGGNIGSLSVHGTVNDLAVSGAVPRYLTLNAFIEEGTPMALLERIVDAMAAAATECGVAVVAGDTKVVGRGECGGVYLATTGIGVDTGGPRLGMGAIRRGDRILVSGPVGDHGAAVLLAREEFGMRGDLQSDAASLLPATRALMQCPGLRFMRDPTRGGLATVVNEIAVHTGLGVALREADIPVSEPTAGICELLGYDPLYLACEGRLLAVVAADEAERALQLLADSGAAPRPALIGELTDGPGEVALETELGGQRVLDDLEEDPLPRIC